MSFPKPIRVRAIPRAVGTRTMPRLIDERVGQPSGRRTVSQAGDGLRPTGRSSARDPRRHPGR